MKMINEPKYSKEFLFLIKFCWDKDEPLYNMTEEILGYVSDDDTEHDGEHRLLEKHKKCKYCDYTAKSEKKHYEKSE